MKASSIFVLFFFIFISGCASSNNSHLLAHDEYLKNEQIFTRNYKSYLIKQNDIKREEITNKLIEVERAYKNKEISKADYLNLRNDLTRELDQNHSNLEQELDKESKRF
jgi:uncharacterized protein YqgQ